jgi:hypothetical protein
MTRVPPVEQFKEACRCPISREARINEKRKNECHSDKGSRSTIEVERLFITTDKAGLIKKKVTTLSLVIFYIICEDRESA